MLMLCALATGCTDAQQGDISAAPHSWVTAVAADPDAFNATIQAEKQGWIALHSNDPHEALTQYHASESPSPTRIRALFDLNVLFHDLASLSQSIQKRTYLDTAPPHAQNSAIAAALCHGYEFMNTEPSSPDPVLDIRLSQHSALIDGEMEPSKHLGLGEHPLQYPEARRGYDPCLFVTQRDYWSDQLLSEAKTSDWREAVSQISSPLFSAWTTTSIHTDDLENTDSPATIGAFSSALSALNMTDAQRIPESSEEARVQARLLGQAFDDEQIALKHRSDAAGQALVADLHLFHGLKQKILLSRARSALNNAQKQAALAYASEAIDISSRVVGPQNSANAYIVLAHARVDTGRTREAMDALQPILKSHPYIRGVYEQLGDLVVLENINRTGESKEN
jgi:tetratricopeptide (TPR) repeat protein